MSERSLKTPGLVNDPKTITLRPGIRSANAAWRLRRVSAYTCRRRSRRAKSRCWSKAIKHQVRFGVGSNNSDAQQEEIEATEEGRKTGPKLDRFRSVSCFGWFNHTKHTKTAGEILLLVSPGQGTGPTAAHTKTRAVITSGATGLAPLKTECFRPRYVSSDYLYSFSVSFRVIRVLRGSKQTSRR